MSIKPDRYIPLDATEFLAAMEGHSDESCVGIKYLRAIAYYWHQTKCQGIRNDDVLLRNICRCHNEAQWDAIRPIIFGEFFTKISGFWHQKRAKIEWENAVKMIEKRRNQTGPARLANPKNNQ